MFKAAIIDKKQSEGQKQCPKQLDITESNLHVSTQDQ